MASVKVRTLKKLKREMWNKNPHCSCCGKLTVLTIERGIQNQDTATIQHLFEKNHPLRKGCYEDIVLFCFECNQKDNTEMQKFYLEQRNKKIISGQFDSL